MGIKDLRSNLGNRVDAAYFLGESTVVTKNDQARAVLVPHGWYEKAIAAIGPTTGLERHSETDSD